MDVVYVFLDTSVLYKDPFFKGNFAYNLLKISREKHVDIYISRIVLKELLKNYEKILLEENSKLSKIISDAMHYDFSGGPRNLFEVSQSLEVLKRFYDSLYYEGVINVLEHDNDMMPEIIDRAVLRKKPFADNKSELKDALTWLTYAKFVEEYELDNCILITENVRDFCDLEALKKDQVIVHEDLLSDTKRFKLFRSIKDFMQSEKAVVSSSSLRFKQWLQHQDFDESFILNLLKFELGSEVKKYVKDKFTYYDLSYVFDSEYSVEGFLSFDDTFFLHKVEAIEISDFGDECVVSGDLYVSCNVQGFEYTSGKDFNMTDAYHCPVSSMPVDDFQIFGEKEIRIKVGFSFYYNQSEKPYNLNVDSVDVVNIN
jgi:PIN domain